MIYSEFKNLKLSMLGMGAMRLPTIDGDYGKIDQEKTEEMVAYAMGNGINYYDTAWGYHNGNSETAMGKALKKYPRESFYLATKFPGYDLSNMTKVEEIFEEQLKKCQVEYFDFYLIHNVCEINIDAYLNPEYGIFEYLMKQKKNGRIRHLGFSVHGDYEIYTRFLDAYGKDMEFCQIQLNYIDWIFQDAKAKVELAEKYGIPVWVMEPLRGGSLCNLQNKYEEKLKELRPDETMTSWAFRFLQSIPSVKVILSGMSNYEQMTQNIETFSENKPLSNAETEVLFDIAEEMTKSKTVPCTACQYCTSYCPKELDIPSLLSLYNEHIFSDGGFIAPMAVQAFPDDKKPNACIACRACEEVCPQSIKISEVLEDFSKKLNL